MFLVQLKMKSFCVGEEVHEGLTLEFMKGFFHLIAVFVFDQYNIIDDAAYYKALLARYSGNTFECFFEL